jgi:hypothetical protein
LILLLAVLAGLIAGLARATYHRSGYHIPDLRLWWLAILAVLPQLLAFLLNLTVIGLNGGLMPISPGTVKLLAPNAPEGSWQVGERLGTTKDIVLPIEEMKLGLLSDRFLLPDWVPYHVAFSLGDLFIALGAFWFLWSFGNPGTRTS